MKNSASRHHYFLQHEHTGTNYSRFSELSTETIHTYICVYIYIYIYICIYIYMCVCVCELLGDWDFWTFSSKDIVVYVLIASYS